MEPAGPEVSWPPNLKVVPPSKPKRRNKSPEADFQKAVVAYLERALPSETGVWWSASMSGVKLPSAKAKGQARDQGLRRGMFDICLIPTRGPDAGQTFWLELKSATGSLTPEQTKLMNVLFPAGRGASARTLEHVCAALTAWGLPIRAHV